MNWINMLSPLQWLVMAAVPPLIVMLYFLKLRRVPVQVPSTYLWQRTVEDLHVNSIWQTLKKNLLLLLQLLVVLALILACLRPGFRGEETLGERSIFMIDNSASMQATDVGPSRLQRAKEQALELVDGLSGNDVAMVIAFSDRADIRQGFTSNRKQLRAAIESITATNRTTNLDEAMRAASGLANPGRTSQMEDLNDIQVAEARPAAMFIFSDGGFSPPQMDLGNLSAEYIAVGTETPDNVSILAFTADRNSESEGQIEAFARIENFGSEPVQVSVSLSLDGALIDATEVEIDAVSSTGVSFDIQDVVEGQLKLEVERDDDFAADNVAFAGLDPPRELEVVLVTAGNTALESALATEQAQSLASVRLVGPEGLESEEFLQLAGSGQIDLFIYDNCAPKTLPEGNTLFLGTLPPGDEWSAGAPAGPLFIIDTNRSHPMLQYVDMGTVRIVEGNALEMPQAGTELLRSNEGVLMAVAPRDAYQDAVLGMPLLIDGDDGTVPNTDWPRKRSFPVFVLNALEFLGGAVSSAGSKTSKPGEPVSLTLASRYSEVEISDPTGKKTRTSRVSGPSLIYTQTDELGFYEAKPPEGDRLLQMFTVNLFSSQESNLTIRPEVQIGAQRVAATGQQKDVVRVEFWRWILALALILLAVEWILYNRRIAV